MARPPAPPGPPPPHYRPPGAPAPRPVGPLGRAPSPDGSSAGGIGPAAATVIALVTLLVGAGVGFALGRGFDVDTRAEAPPLTRESTTTSRPPGDTIPQQSPGPPATDAPAVSPGTELAPATIGSFDDPIPAGQAYILGLYEIEVLSARRDALPTLQDFEPANPPPPEGRQHVLVELRIRSTDLGNPSRISFFLSDGTGQWFDFESSCGIVPDDLGSSGFLESDEEIRGNRCFTVPLDVVDDVVLGTEGFAGPVYFALPG